MTTKIINADCFPLRALALAVALGSASTAGAANFKIGEIEGQFDSSLSLGASWGLRDADKKFVGVPNGGSASSSTSDDGRLNFKKGETFSKIFKGIHDLELKYGDTGVFLRGKYWYDFEQKDESRELYDINDNGRKRLQKSSGVALLDAFIYHNYSVADLPGSVRVGKQVVSWGEGMFIGNGINSINPIDVSAFRRPGSQIKEGLLPVNMLYVNQGVSENLSVEAFYQLEWDQTTLDNCGTFFAGTDLLAEGCNTGLIIDGNDYDPANAVYVPRGGDRDARDSGQFGIALRWYAEQLNETEFGLYAMNYHSRNPYYGMTVGNGDLALVPYVPPAMADSYINSGAKSASYFFEYPEDIRLYGLSFSTNIAGTAVSGEISYRPNMPIDINSSDISTASLYGQNLQLFDPNGGVPIFTTGFTPMSEGSVIPGYQRKPYTQVQVSAIKLIEQVFGADRLTLLGELGYAHIGGLGKTDGSDLRFGRSPVFGLGELPGAYLNDVCRTQGNPANPQYCNNSGFYTSNSWGYRLFTSLEFNNAIAGVNLVPTFAFSHDVKGYGPSFSEGAKSASIGLNAEYQSKYTASISYTDYFGGDWATFTDRDYVSASVGVTF